MDDGPARFEHAPAQAARATSTEVAAADPASPALPPVPPHLADPRVLTILTTEHWSLLTARSLVYNEAFSRGQMFLTFLSASLVAVGFVAGGGETGDMLPLVVVAVLAMDLFIGLATLGRIASASTEEIRAMQGMARLRHAYLEIAPDLEPYFITPAHDDIWSVLTTYGNAMERPSAAQNVLHGFTTMPGMIAAIDAAVLGALSAMVLVVVGLAPLPAFLIGVAIAILFIAVLAAAAARFFQTAGNGTAVAFPNPEVAEPQDGRRNT